MKKFAIIFIVFTIAIYGAFTFQEQVVLAKPKAPPEIVLLTKWIKSYYEGNAEKFWAVASKFENPQFESLEDVRAMMTERMGEREMAIAVDRMPYLGIAKTLSQNVENIEYRIDNMGEDSAMYVLTAWVNRVIDFTYDEGRTEVTRKAALKVYVTVRNGKFIKYFSDETEMEKSFSNLKLTRKKQ